MTFAPAFTITNRMTQAITRIERARGFLEAAQLSDDWVREVGEQALIREAHHTTHIEGTRLTLDQAERLWKGEAVPEADPDDARELLNYRTAFEFVSECLDSGDPITEGMIREIHRKLVEGVRGGSAAPGEYRRIQNYVVNAGTGQVIYTPPTAVEVPVMMSELVKWLNADLDIHPVLVSGIAQFQLMHIHPFLDGNGRASRLLSTLCLYKAGYDFKRLFTISEYYDRDRPTFYKSIQKRARQRHGHDRLARLLRHRPGNPDGRGARTQRTGHPPRRAGETARPERAPGQGAGLSPPAWQADHPGLRSALPDRELPQPAAGSEGDAGQEPDHRRGGDTPSGISAAMIFCDNFATKFTTDSRHAL